MKTTFAMVVLSCLVFALAPTDAEIPSRQLRAEDDATESPLKAFKVVIQKFQKPQDARQLRGEEDAKETIKKFLAVMTKLKEKRGGARRTEEEHAEIHVDNLLKLVNGHK